MIRKTTPERLSFFSDAIFGMSPNFFGDEGTLWAIYSVLCLDLPQNRFLRPVLLSRLLQLESDPEMCFPKEYRLKAM